ncbi:MAG: tetratricopeptide repeat protein [Candidatus Latescibacterota bacterium]|nr:MAG: tetratricopeptide repeat protein [Candidatus Latescibacterota bacterium]
MIRSVFVWFAGAVVAALISSSSLAQTPQPDASDAALKLDLKDHFERANAFYESGDYFDAVKHYETLVGVGVEDEHLFYNLGNAYYRTNELGRAVLFYERALRLSPRDSDTRENLSLVRTQLRDRQFVREQNRIVGTIVWLHNNLNKREMLVFASVCYLLTCLLAIVFVFRDSRTVRAVYDKVSMVSPGRLAGLTRSQDLIAVIILAGCLFLTSGVSSYLKVKSDLRRDDAVVLEREIPVFSSPTEDATLQFKIHEGTVLKIRQQSGGWVRIGLPGGLSGWVSNQSISQI